MADEINRDAERQLRIEADLRQKIAESSAEYLKLLRDIKAMHKSIATVDKEIEKKKKIINELEGINTDEARTQLELEKAKLAILSKNKKELEETTVLLTKIAKETRGLDKSFAFLGEAAKDIGAIASGVKKGYGLLKNWAGLFEIDKSIRMASLNMGLLNKRSEGFRDTLKAAGNNTISFGVGIKELAALQASYSEELGRSVLLTQTGLEALGQMAAASNLGAEGAAKMAADMEQQGYSAERTRDFVVQTMTDASKMGLNASKVIKNIQQNMKLLNKYNFKGGVKGLAKMAETTSKLGIDMNSVAGMADKLFDIEGAVDMSSQLQVLGGSWAQLADPFHLMYMARNDMAGLTEEIANAAASSAHFNAENKDFEISAMEMHRLRKIAEQTGISYDELATAAKNAARASKVKTQISYGFDKPTQEFIENTSKFNEKGEAVININGNPKLVKQLSAMDKTALEAMIKEEANLKERAEASQTFDEKLTNLITQIKQMLLPVLEGIDKALRPIVQKLVDALQNKELMKSIQEFATSIGKFIGSVGKFIYEHPVWSAALFGMFEAAKWYLSGRMLAKGFNDSASVGGSGGGSGSGGGGILDAIGNIGGKSGKFGKFGKTKGGMSLGKSLGKGMKVGGGLGIASLALEGGRSMLDNEDSGFGKALGVGADAAEYASYGAMLGSVIPGLGTAAGGIIGGLIGAGKGLYDEYFSEEAQKKSSQPVRVQDGIVFNQKDKFLKMNDGAMIAGTNVNGNKDLAKAITNQSPSASPSSMKIEFGEIKFGGEIKLSLPGNQTMSLDLKNDAVFMRELTRMVHAETKKVIDGGKIKP
jgi:hypothetical protein